MDSNIIMWSIVLVLCILLEKVTRSSPPAPTACTLSKANQQLWMDEVNLKIRDMRCHRCNSNEAPEYRIEQGKEKLTCCCKPFYLEIRDRINQISIKSDGKELFANVSIAEGETRLEDQGPPLGDSLGSSSEPPMLKKEKISRPVGEPEIRITYVDAEGNETTREISDLRYSTPYYFKAHCHLRGEERSFCPDRIEEACDLNTGEILEEIHVKWGNKGKMRSFPIGD